MPWSPLDFHRKREEQKETKQNKRAWSPHVTRHSTAGIILQTARTIYKHLYPWHILSPVLHLCVFCLGPPRSAVAMSGSSCCHRNNPEECLWQVFHRRCLLLLDCGCLHGCMNRQANTSHTSWQQTLVFYWRSNTHEGVIYVTGRLARGPVGLFFVFVQYLDKCECIDITLPACCAFSLCYSFEREYREEEGWQSLFLFLHSSFSFSPGGTRWRICRKDRHEITSVISANTKVCQQQCRHKSTLKHSSPLPPLQLHLPLLSLLICQPCTWNHHLWK